MLQHQRPPEKEKTSLLGRFFRKVDGCDIEFAFVNRKEEQRVVIDDPYDRTSEKMHLFMSNEPIQGAVQLRPRGGGYKHNGISVDLIGLITTRDERENKIEFMRQRINFAPATVSQQMSLDFAFPEDKPYESYRGINATVQYFVRVVIQRPIKDVEEQEELWVSKIDEQRSAEEPAASEGKSYFREKEFGPRSVAMEVGVENMLHIEFKYDKKTFHLKERVLGRVTFKLMDLDLQYGELAIVRKEYIGAGRPNDPVETETMQKFEIMDGTPIVGEVVPIRLYLNSVPRLTPSYPNVHNCFRVLYFLNLVLITGEGKRYFKQQEITLYRRTGQHTPSNMQV
jgi:vacuolar protein sorting-associated protein 26